MRNEIGMTAGKVWNYLRDHGPSSTGKLKSGTNLSAGQIERAIGWLACENKITAEKKGRCTNYFIKE